MMDDYVKLLKCAQKRKNMTIFEEASLIITLHKKWPHRYKKRPLRGLEHVHISMIAFDNYSHYSGYNEIMSKIMFCYTKTIIDLCTASAPRFRAAPKWAENRKEHKEF